MSAPIATENCPPHDFRALKQPFGDKSCIAYVAAMASGTDIPAFRCFVRGRRGGDESPPYTERELYAYLLENGIIAGQAYAFNDAPFPSDIPESVLVSLKIRGQAAYLKVKSKHSGWDHCVYWDGSQVWDPSPYNPHGMPLSSYQIEVWVPLNPICP